MKEFLSTVYLLLLSVLSIAFFLFSLSLAEWVYYQEHFWFIVSAYFTLAITIFVLWKIFSKKVLQIIAYIVLSPLLIFYLPIKAAMPIMILVLAMMLFFGLSSLVPTLIIKTSEYYDGWFLNENIQTLILWGGSSSISILFFKPISIVINRLLRLAKSEKLRKSFIPNVTNYIVTIDNVRMVIYAGFFVFLSIYSFNLFSIDFKPNENYSDKAVLNAFLIFLALDRVLLYSRKVNFKSSNLLSRFIVILKNEFK